MGLLAAAVAGNPASVFIQRISDALEGGLKPWQIRRVAAAEADVAHLKAISELTIAALQDTALLERASVRVAAEEMRDQRNIEAAIFKALPNLHDGARPEELDDDWLVNFFDKCRLISNEEMQRLWAQVLAGEANEPGSFSSRTVNFLSSLSRKEAQSFRTLCCYNWRGPEGAIYPIIFQRGDTMPVPLLHEELIHLQNIGLVTYHYGGFRTGGLTLPTDRVRLTYHDVEIEVEHRKSDQDAYSTPSIYLGGVTLTQVGTELASICDPPADYKVVDYAVAGITRDGRVVSSPTATA